GRGGRSFDLGVCLKPGFTVRGTIDRCLSPRTHGTPHSGTRNKCPLRLLFLRIPDPRSPQARSVMQISDFDYELPEDLIAQQPLAERDASRMLIVVRQTNAL